MLINCSNKGCLKSSEALYDTTTGEVLCQECGDSINNISEPMKRTLKSSGQIVRAAKKAFAMYCRNCNANRQVVFAGDNTVCSICKSDVKVPAPMKQALKEIAAKVRDEE